MKAVRLVLLLLVGTAAVGAALPAAREPVIETLVIRGRPQALRLYGSRAGGDPVIVSSGDGGWIHLGPHVAETLAAQGFFVVGFDTKAYLEGFTAGRTTLRPEDEPNDYRALVDFATGGGRASSKKPILVGVSEGAGLSLLAASDATARQAIAGVVALGLPKVNELGWRWKDSLIYVTHETPNEPSFTTASVVTQLAGTPFAVIHSTADEFVPLSEVQKLLALAPEPKQLWIVKATDHRFTGNLAEFDEKLVDAVNWVRQHQPR